VARPAEHLAGGAGLHQLPGVHHGHPLTGLGDDGEVVGDEDQREAELLLEVGQQGHHLLLERDVQRRGRLVGDEQLGPAGDRHRDHHPLPHAAGQLPDAVPGDVAVAAQADELEELGDPRAALRAREVEVGVEPFGDLLADGEDRVQGGHRLLEDEADVPAGERPPRSRAHADQLGAGERHRPAGRQVVGQQAGDGRGGDGLAGTGLADQRQRLAAVEVEADAVHGRELALDAVDVHGEVAQPQQRGRVGRRRGGGGGRGGHQAAAFPYRTRGSTAA
jgi:hypothetical protein